MKKLISVLIIFISIFIGCSSEANKNEPPKIILGQDPCDYCSMLINEYKFSSALWLENGEAKRFDDIGCMINFIQKTDKKVLKTWVYDFHSKKPVEAEEAYYVVSKEIVTPMGFGIAAFKSKNEAEKYAGKNNTEVINFNKLTNNKQIFNME